MNDERNKYIVRIKMHMIDVHILLALLDYAYSDIAFWNELDDNFREKMRIVLVDIKKEIESQITDLELE